MVDLIGQYSRIQEKVNSRFQNVLSSAAFIKGPEVKEFEASLADFLSVDHVIGCGNGTDALQIALMALKLQPGDEVIVPSFTFIASVEVIALMGLTPVCVDVNLDDFNMNIKALENAITDRTKAILPVHLFGQCSDMDAIMEIAKRNELFVIEDNAQSIGARYTSNDGRKHFAGTIGDIGTTSFYPSKNLGCYGDGGATMTNNPDFEDKIAMIANHGMKRRYYHDVVGINSRLDSLQAAVLNVKLTELANYNSARQKAADQYDKQLGGIEQIKTPHRFAKSDHIFHQYTIRILNGQRDQLKEHLSSAGIPSMVYYPVAAHRQPAFAHIFNPIPNLPNTDLLIEQVLSLPMHTELQEEQIEFICNEVKSFFNEH